MARHLHSVSRSYPRKDRVRVVLADDHVALRRSLRHVLDSEPGVEVIGEADDTAATLRQVRTLRPDVLVLDLRMATGSMVERIERLRERAPNTQIVLITMDKNQLMAEHALRAGAMGFVLTDSADLELGDAVRCAARGVRYTSPRLAPAA